MGLTYDRNNPGLKKIRKDGQQETYLVLSDEERAKGFLRPVRHSYIHLKCGGKTDMGQALCATYARNPGFYTGTFCCSCGQHFNLRYEQDGKMHWAFEWVPEGDPVGSNVDEAQEYLTEKQRQENEKLKGGGI